MSQLFKVNTSSHMLFSHDVCKMHGNHLAFDWAARTRRPWDKRLLPQQLLPGPGTGRAQAPWQRGTLGPRSQAVQPLPPGAVPCPPSSGGSSFRSSSSSPSASSTPSSTSKSSSGGTLAGGGGRGLRGFSTRSHATGGTGIGPLAPGPLPGVLCPPPPY